MSAVFATSLGSKSSGSLVPRVPAKSCEGVCGGVNFWGLRGLLSGGVRGGVEVTAEAFPPPDETLCETQDETAASSASRRLLSRNLRTRTVLGLGLDTRDETVRETLSVTLSVTLSIASTAKMMASSGAPAACISRMRLAMLTPPPDKQ